MKISTFVFIGSLLAISLEKVHSDNNEVDRQHRKDEEVVSVDELVGESSIGSVRAGRRSSNKNREKKKQQRSKRTDGETDKSDEEESNRRSRNKRGGDHNKSDGKRGSHKNSEHNEHDKKRGGGRRGGRNADNNEESQENNDEKKGGGRGGGGGARARNHDKKNNKRGNRNDGQDTSGNHKKHGNQKKKREKEGRKFRKRLDLKNEQVIHSAGVTLVPPSVLVGGVPLPAETVSPPAKEEVGHGMKGESHKMDKKMMGKSEKESPDEAEGKHEMMKKKKENNVMGGKSEKESVHKGPHEQVPTEITYESTNTVETSANKFASAGTSKRKQRYEKPDRDYRRRNHPRQPPPPSGGSNGGRFAVPPAAKQKTPGRQHHSGLGGKSDKMAP